MVARGDLGVEIEYSELPPVQRELVRKCTIAGKPVLAEELIARVRAQKQS